MPEDRNRRTVRAAVRAIEDGTPEALDDLVADEVLDHASADSGRGRNGVKEGLVAFRTAFADVRIEVEDELAAGDRVVHRATVRGTHQGWFMGVAPTGREVAWSVVNWWRLEDGRIVERWSIADRLALVTQLGLEVRADDREAAT